MPSTMEVEINVRVGVTSGLVVMVLIQFANRLPLTDLGLASDCTCLTDDTFLSTTRKESTCDMLN